MNGFLTSKKRTLDLQLKGFVGTLVYDGIVMASSVKNLLQDYGVCRVSDLPMRARKSFWG